MSVPDQHPERRTHGAHTADRSEPADPSARLHAAREQAHHRLTRHRRGRALRGTVSVALVMALAGALFTANARLAAGTNTRQPQDLAGLQANEDARRERLADQVAELRASVDALTQEQTDNVGLEWQSAGPAFDIASGKVAVSGRGITVSLDDAPADGPRPAGTVPDDLVVHQQDLQAVINALWAGGAEAMALMDQRVISTSAFQCIGNVLSLQGRRYSPPYVVTAVGDPQELVAALNADPAVRAYRSWVDAVGLGWQVTRPDADLQVPAYDGSVDMRYASVPLGTEVLPGLVADGSTATDAQAGQGSPG
jgi:uncharacterized protein YlxW (UPF0749 family)